MIQPFRHAAGKGAGLGLRTRQSAIELDGACTLVEEDLPVLGRPAIFGWAQQRHDAGLVTRQEIDHSRRGRHGRRQH
jgi:hypothetical protein